MSHGRLIISKSRAIVDAGAHRRKWWSAHRISGRADVPITPLDAALIAVSVGRVVGIATEDVKGRDRAIRVALATGIAVDRSHCSCITEVLNAVHPTLCAQAHTDKEKHACEAESTPFSPSPCSGCSFSE